MHTPMSLAFHLAPPRVQPQQCLNARHRQAGCQLCVDHCPAQAIQLAPDPRPLPMLDEEACVGCGVCIPACPTDAWGQASSPETALLSIQDELPDAEALALACPQHPQPQQTPARAAYVIRHQRCLAAFSVEALLQLSRDGQRMVWLEDTPCATCPLGQAQADIHAHAQAVNQLLAGFDLPPAIHLASQVPEDETDVVVKPVLDGAAPAVDRRGFFRSLGKMARARLDEASVRAEVRPMLDPGAPVDQRLPYHVPPSLRKLNRHLASLENRGHPQPTFLLDADALPWSDLILDPATCSGCQLCARFCPTGALNYLWGEIEEGLVFNLTFHPQLCLDCNICVAVCPENALTLSSSVSLAALLAPERELLLADYLVPCQRCGTLTRLRPGDEEALCFVCRGPTMYRQHTQKAYLEALAQRLLRSAKTSPDGESG